MKRCFFGTALLIVLLAACLLTDRAAARAPERIAWAMEQASASALRSEPQKTAALTQWARAAWESSRRLQTRVRHEDLIQQVDLLFADLQSMKGREAGRLYSAVCLNLRVRARALADQDPLRCLRPGR